MRSGVGFTAPSIALAPRCDSLAAQTSSSPQTPRRPKVPESDQQPSYVIIMRHGLTDWNYAGRVQGGLDTSRLHWKGVRQAKAAGKSLRNVNIDTVFCSPLTRAKDTFEIVTENSRNPFLLSIRRELLPSLCEIQVPWQGLLKTEISTSVYAEEYGKYLKNPPLFTYNGFNPFRDIVRRAGEVWDTVGRATGSRTLVMAHNQMNKALICSALGIPFNLQTWRQSNCCFNVFMFENGKPARLRLSNGTDLSHRPSLPCNGRPKPGCTRLILHRQGDFFALRRLLRANQASQFFLIGDSSRSDLRHADGSMLQEEDVLRIPWPVNAESSTECLRSAVDIVNSLKMKYVGEGIVLSVNDSSTFCAFVSACIGMGAEGVERFFSDPGGVTVLDVRASAPVGKAPAYVLCHNVGARPSLGPLLGYTRSSAA